jgi:ATP-dependent DNA helicase DinG
VARTLGARELLLVHAPTGTGKTLAYLVPALLWARRHDVRIGVATYTRALQEQALDREVPRALAALARAGVAPGTRVTLLKGRDNYLCWRALKSVSPEDESGEAWLAWSQVATFATTDLEGDLDRLPRRSPIRLASSAPYQRALETLLRGVRGQTGCCTHKADRAACGAEVARKRAEKSHVVLVNQAFALARPEFFRRLVFDECEHLHDQAHNAWSRTLSFREMRAILGRLRQPERPHSRAVLDRLERQALPGTPSGDQVERCIAAHEALDACVEDLELAAAAFDAWRREELRLRPESEQHFLMREYAERQGRDLVRARVETSHAGALLETALADLAERIAELPLRSGGGLRRALDLARADLDEALTTIGAWLPIEDDAPRFSDAYFYDVEPEPRGGLVLAARVLLPNEVLGSTYYPELAGAAFLSATTWIAGGFDSAKAYLGLDRAEVPRANEDRIGARVRTFRAPDVFDWGRVLVAIPKDAPSVQREKDAFLAYVRRFVAHLGERTRGRMLVLFTNASDLKKVGEDLVGFFRARRIPFWFQGQDGTVKEELADLFRARVGSVLMGVDTFWFGADFPGETLEYLVIVKLPYGVPDRYHQAQCAAIGTSEQRRRIYMPKALSKFRQGFGRLMRRETDRGCVFVLDPRVLEPRHRAFLRELPVAPAFAEEPQESQGLARLVRGDTDHCVREALAHMGLLEAARRQGLDAPFERDPGP